MTLTVTVNKLSYSFGSSRVLGDISADFTNGATVLLGPNGAGKSTLLELLASVRRPATGSIEISDVGLSTGRGVKRATYRRAVAWLPQTFYPFPGLCVREQVAYSGWLKGMTRGHAWDKSARALDMVGMAPHSLEAVKHLSGGQQKRVGIAGALVHDAKVVLLDEPTAGLDPAQRKRLRDVLESIAENRVVVVSSHDADDAHGKFPQVAVLQAGRLKFFGPMHTFVESTSRELDPRDRVEAAYTALVGADE